MQRRKRLWSVLLALTLLGLPRATAQSATQSPTESCGLSGDAANWSERELMIMQIAEEEIERTSQEAVKAALLEVGGELAYWKERADLFEGENAKLAWELERTQKATATTKTQWLWNGIAIGVGVAGIAAGILAFCLR